MTARAPRRRLLAAIGIMMLTILVGTAMAVAINAQSPDELAVRTLVGQALNTARTLPIDAGKAVPGQARTAFVQSANDQLSHFYIGDALRQKMDMINMDLGTDVGGADQGGIGAITFESVKVGASGATVKATVDTWNNWTPTGIASYEYAFHLVKTADSWLIDSETADFAPGSQP